MGSLEEQDNERLLFSLSKFPRFFPNFLCEQVLHLKPEDCHPKITAHCRNEAKTMGIFWVLWAAFYPVPMSSSELMLEENSSPSFNFPTQRVHEGRGRKEKQGERQRTRQDSLEQNFSILGAQWDHLWSFKKNPRMLRLPPRLTESESLVLVF